VELFRYELEQAVKAEGLGIDGVWAAEHHFNPGYVSSPLFFLSAVAARTSSIRLGTAVLLPALYHPVRLAEEVALLDTQSGGRVELGVGMGTVAQEFACFGVDPAKRVGIVREILDVCRLAWTGEEFSYQGKYFNFDRICVLPRPAQRPHPPILGGAISVAGAQRTGRWGLPLQWIDRALGDAYLESFIGAGYPKDRARIDGYMNLFVCDDPEATWPVAREPYLYQYGRHVCHGQTLIAPGGAPLDVPPPTLETVDALRDSGAILVLTAQEAIEALRTQAEGLPVSGIVCPGRVPGLPEELNERHVELMATVVKPGIAGFGVPTGPDFGCIPGRPHQRLTAPHNSPNHQERS
jgi:alkanesulfonate monooxygenase SsuD/methylene tetrahydromethanopterin reductase-like flavin-dependent oxidoreductase (luciferase family)